jgi:fused signal recognition particle receptor
LKEFRHPKQTENTRPAGLFGRLREKLTATQRSFTRGLSDLLLGSRALDDSLFEELETLLLSADVGVETTQYLLKGITEQVSRKQLTDTRAVYHALRQSILSIVEPCSRKLDITPVKPFVIMVVGVNGVGKTTTIAKLANRLKNNGHAVMLAAADTFRAAAIEQLKTWAGRLDIPVIAQHTGADAAAVVHDAVNAANARGSDILIVDTAGRQHTQAGLMDELKKIKRVIGKADSAAPHEVLLVLDAGTGQNALSQLTHFGEAVGVTGLALTKLDGTARGGILIAIARKTGLPIRYIGVGEGMDDLREFDAGEYVDALLPAP